MDLLHGGSSAASEVRDSTLHGRLHLWQRGPCTVIHTSSAVEPHLTNDHGSVCRSTSCTSTVCRAGIRTLWPLSWQVFFLDFYSRPPIHVPCPWRTPCTTSSCSTWNCSQLCLHEEVWPTTLLELAGRPAGRLLGLRRQLASPALILWPLRQRLVGFHL